MGTSNGRLRTRPPPRSQRQASASQEAAPRCNEEPPTDKVPRDGGPPNDAVTRSATLMGVVSATVGRAVNAVPLTLLALGQVFAGIVSMLWPTAERQDMLDHVSAAISDLAAVIAAGPDSQGTIATPRTVRQVSTPPAREVSGSDRKDRGEGRGQADYLPPRPRPSAEAWDPPS
jgi:hypothetical protein